MGSVLRARAPFDVKRIAVIGAGPAGLATAKYLQAEKCFDRIDVIEQQAEVGGVWYYTPPLREKVPVPSDSPNAPLGTPARQGDSVPIFSNPMYEHLNTNIPKDLMAFTDCAFSTESLLFPTRQDVQEYLIQYSLEVRPLISFCTQVDRLRVMDEDRWELTTKSTLTGVSMTVVYDAVVVCNGHYSVPFIPSVTGIEAFNTSYPDLITHSKIYRSPEMFTNKKVIVVGSGASGLDIGTQISHVCQKPLLNSVRTQSPLDSGQENKEQVPPIAEFLIEERGVRFEDGRVERNIDAIVYCTGYLYSYPFLKDLTPPVVTTGRRVINVYQYIFDMYRPTLVFIALPQKVVPFPLSEVQAAAVSKVWSNKLELPEQDDMRKWEKNRVEEKGEGTSFHVLGYPEDAEYINGLYNWAKQGGCGEEPAFWGPKQIWYRENYTEIRKKFIETGGHARTVEELGFRIGE